MTGARILIGDCRLRLKELPDNSVDSVVTDPPYELGFMGRAWDRTGVANDVAMWREVLRVLKPGGHLIAFSGTRTYHRMAAAIEDAGFEVRDMISWHYGSGFPKSLDVSKAIDKAAGVEFEARPASGVGFMGPGGVNGWNSTNNQLARTGDSTDAAREWQGWGTALKPATEPTCLARKPLSESNVAANVLKWGTGALNIDGCRVRFSGDADAQSAQVGGRATGKPLSKLGGVADDRAAFVPSDNSAGRWPANVIHDGSAEIVAGFPAEAGAAAPAHKRGADKFRGTYGAFGGNIDEAGSTFHGDSGSAARFFYCAKADSDERGSKCLICHRVAARPDDECRCSQCALCDAIDPCGCLDPETKLPPRKPRRLTHPTVKPHALMAWLVRLVTPKGGTVLDPFLGTGSTAVAAQAEQFGFVGCELSADYAAIAEGRLRRDGGLFASVAVSPAPPAESAAA